MVLRLYKNGKIISRKSHKITKIDGLVEVKKLKATYQTDRTEVSSCGFGNSPESKTISSNDHHSRLQSSTWKSNII